MAFIKFIIWLVLFVAIADSCLDMVSSASTIENILGILGIAVMVVLSYKTKCFTIIKIKKK